MVANLGLLHPFHLHFEVGGSTLKISNGAGGTKQIEAKG